MKAPKKESRLVADYLDAVSRGAIDEVKPMLADDVIFRGSRRQAQGADAYISILRRQVAPVTKRLKVERIFQSGSFVCAQFDLVPEGDVEPVRMIEVFEVVGSVFRSVELSFDTKAMEAVWAMLPEEERPNTFGP